MFFQRPDRYFAVLCVFNFLGVASIALASPPLTAPLAQPIVAPDNTAKTLDIFKIETYPCGEKWISQLAPESFQATSHHPTDLTKENVKPGFAPSSHSCHAGVSAETYVLEAHILALLIQHFLAKETMGAIGLAVQGMFPESPNMDIDSPNIEMGRPGVGNYLTPYDVRLKAHGSSSVYTKIDPIDKQYRGIVHEN